MVFNELTEYYADGKLMFSFNVNAFSFHSRLWLKIEWNESHKLKTIIHVFSANNRNSIKHGAKSIGYIRVKSY